MWEETQKCSPHFLGVKSRRRFYTVGLYCDSGHWALRRHLYPSFSDKITFMFKIFSNNSTKYKLFCLVNLSWLYTVVHKGQNLIHYIGITLIKKNQQTSKNCWIGWNIKKLYISLNSKFCKLMNYGLNEQLLKQEKNKGKK